MRPWNFGSVTPKGTQWPGDFVGPECPWCRNSFGSWPAAKVHVKNCPEAPRPRWMARQRRSKQMAEPKTAIEPLSLREVAFEHFEEFFESIIEQSQFTPE